MIRTRQHKYIARNQAYGRCYSDELYDLQIDPRETKNVIDEPAYQVIFKELAQALQRHFDCYREPAFDGWDIESQPVCNNDAPWLRGLMASENDEHQVSHPQ